MSFTYEVYEKMIRVGLSDLCLRKQLCFGAACSERIYSFYNAIYSESDSLRNMLDLIWTTTTGETISLDPQIARECYALLPDNEDPDLEESYAIDAIAAVYYCFEAIHAEDPLRYFEWTSQCSLGIASQLASNDLFDRHGMKILPTGSTFAHPFTQKEALDQLKDLKSLMNPAVTGEQIRERAVANRILAPAGS